MPNGDGYDYWGVNQAIRRQPYLFFVKNSGLSTGVPHLTYIQ